MGVVTKNDFPHLVVGEENGRGYLALDGYELKNVESYEIKSGEDKLLPGTATLMIKMAVKYP